VTTRGLGLNQFCKTALEKKETIHAVFFDFSKAFDLVNHKRLMQKFKKLLLPYLTSWIAEWLRDRKQ
jgi:hypothetical protein